MLSDKGMTAKTISKNLIYLSRAMAVFSDDIEQNKNIKAFLIIILNGILISI